MKYIIERSAETLANLANLITNKVIDPSHEPNPSPIQSTKASWYSIETNSPKNSTETASGIPLDDNELTAAHKTLPFGSLVIVSHDGKSVLVKITDRGPFVDGRDLDLTIYAFKQLDDLVKGVIDVEFEVIYTPDKGGK